VLLLPTTFCSDAIVYCCAGAANRKNFLVIPYDHVKLFWSDKVRISPQAATLLGHRKGNNFELALSQLKIESLQVQPMCHSTNTLLVRDCRTCVRRCYRSLSSRLSRLDPCTTLLQDAVRVTGIDDKIVHRPSMFGSDKGTLLKFLQEHYDDTCAPVGKLQLEVIN
jgi:hypothetical protein